MSTIQAILEPDADGTLHLPLPQELRHGRIEITATLKLADGNDVLPTPRFGCLAGKIHLARDFDEPLEDFSDDLGIPLTDC